MRTSMLRRLGLAKFVLFTMAPLTILLVLGEIVCRTKYFLLHDYDWNYLTAPLVVQDTQVMNRIAFVEEPTVEQVTGAAPMTVRWHRPCRNRDVFSQRHGRPMPYTYDDHCFRGDRVALVKPPDEFRIFVLGGSTIEDSQPDGETAVDYLKRALPESYAGRTVKIVNAGHSAYGSGSIVVLFDTKVRLFDPDVVIYSEAWNEQVDYSQWMQVDNRIGQIQSRLHRALHYRSMLYTYLVEKIHFSTTEAVRFWKIDLDRLSKNFVAFAEAIAASSATLVFVTQPIQLDRYHRDVDTFDFEQMNRLLDALKGDPDYVYDTLEISALNQRLAVAFQTRLAQQYGIPVIDILPDIEALGPERRRELFVDLGHRSWIGNQIVGEMIARKLRPLVWKVTPLDAADPVTSATTPRTHAAAGRP